MPKSSSKSKNALHIQEKADADRDYVIHPESNDIFIRSGKQIVAACQLGISVEVWINEIESLVDHVDKWCRDRSARIRACFLSPAGMKSTLFFIPKTGHFDFDLADELAVLSVELMNHFNVGTIELRQIPWTELDRFLNPMKAALIYGERPAAS